MSTTALAYGFGYVGMMLTPLHTCFVVTGEYFKTGIFGAYRYIIGPIAMIAVCALMLGGIYRIAF